MTHFSACLHQSQYLDDSSLSLQDLSLARLPAGLNDQLRMEFVLFPSICINASRCSSRALFHEAHQYRLNGTPDHLEGSILPSCHKTNQPDPLSPFTWTRLEYRQHRDHRNHRDHRVWHRLRQQMPQLLRRGCSPSDANQRSSPSPPSLSGCVPTSEAPRPDRVCFIAKTLNQLTSDLAVMAESKEQTGLWAEEAEEARCETGADASDGASSGEHQIGLARSYAKESSGLQAMWRITTSVVVTKPGKVSLFGPLGQVKRGRKHRQKMNQH
ncbi:unnamed protein product [Protopolystoma xenopodis]|uniref:Uncharacterized protein n=1 Tax=Protopolystoma xenopodis TaxID=117903 RepID=A0A3S5APY7_9PLAT|nr:unnamed protein product [Protopolystoma xenopodis]